MIAIREKTLGVAGTGLLIEVQRYENVDGGISGSVTWVQWMADSMLLALGPEHAADVMRERFVDQGFGDEADPFDIRAAFETRYGQRADA